MAFANISFEEALVLEAYEEDILDEEETLLAFELKFGFIKRVDKGWITTVEDLESWRFER